MTKKNVALRVFKITNNSSTKKDCELKKLLFEKLNITKIQDKTRLVKQNTESNVYHVVSNFELDNEDRGLFCSFLKLDFKDEIDYIPKTLFDKTKFNLSDLNSIKNDEQSFYVINNYYFYISETYLITADLSLRENIKDLYTYLSNLLSLEDFNILPELDKSELNASEIRSVEINTSNNKNRESHTHNINTNKVLDITKTMVENLFSYRNNNELDLSDFLDAKLIISFKKPKNIEQEKYQEVVENFLNSTNDPADITFIDKNGKKRTKGADAMLSKKVKVDYVENTQHLNEEQLKNEIRSFLKVLLNEKNIT